MSTGRCQLAAHRPERAVLGGPGSGKAVTVVGLGRFGGGVGVTRWLCRQGAQVTVSDQAPAGRPGRIRRAPWTAWT